MNESFDRDRMASHYAHRHYSVDTGVQEIFYLPTGSPEREIRFLEVNTMIPDVYAPEPVDFGVAVDGPDAHRSLVLDVTQRRWEAIQKKELGLPNGWTLENKRPMPGRQ